MKYKHVFSALRNKMLKFADDTKIVGKVTNDELILDLHSYDVWIVTGLADKVKSCILVFIKN